MTPEQGNQPPEGAEPDPRNADPKQDSGQSSQKESQAKGIPVDDGYKPGVLVKEMNSFQKLAAKTRALPKTIMDIVVSPKDLQQNPSAGGANQPEGLAKEKSGFQKMIDKSKSIPKTLLDIDACRGVVDRLLVDREGKVKELQDQASKEPLKPFVAIDKYKKSSLCPLKWDEFSGTSRIRYCEKCQLQIYDFSKVELPEAEELIKNREDKDKGKFDFYKRLDGKFMTTDCPVGRARERNLMLTAAGGILTLVLATFLLFQAPPPPAQQATSSGAAGQAQQAQSPKVQAKSGNEKHSHEPIPRPIITDKSPGVLTASLYHKDDDPNPPTNRPEGAPGTVPDPSLGNILYHKDDTPNPSMSGPAGAPQRQEDIKFDLNPRYQAAVQLEHQNGPAHLPAGFPLRAPDTATAGNATKP